MNSGLNPADPTLVAAFRNALLHQSLVALAVIVFLVLLWATARTWFPGSARAAAARQTHAQEAPARRLLRVGFGLLWVLDGALQAQPKMAGGLASQVIQPAAASSPAWVRHLVNWGGTIWSYHPIQSAAAAVWIQVGIGAWLLVSARGLSSRLAGLASVGWGLVVWVFGEAFGGIFAPGLTLLFGAPGAVLFYVVAGTLIALPDRCWSSPRLGPRLLGGTGLFLIGMAVLQAWPGRGYWQGGKNGTLSGMIGQMTSAPQPHVLAHIVSAAASVSAAHGWAVNLLAVVSIGGLGVAFLTGQRSLVRYAAWYGAAFCLADWLLIEDLGFLGGLGTDPNSMVPFVILFTAGYLALAPRPAALPKRLRPIAWLWQPAGYRRLVATTMRTTSVVQGDVVLQEAREPVEVRSAATEAESDAMHGTEAADVAHDVGDDAEGCAAGAGAGRQAGAKGVRGVAGRVAAAGAPAVAALSAVAVIVVGAVPMAAVAADRNADPILAEAIGGASAVLDIPAPDFTLTDQGGRTVSLGGLRGKVVLLTFLDPVCTTDCPIIGAEFKQAGQLLGADAKNVVLVGIVANPAYLSQDAVHAYDHEVGLDTVPDWRYLTGSLGELEQVWAHYGITVQNLPAGSMAAHNDMAFVITPDGRIRNELNSDPGPGTAATQSSFAVLLSHDARQALAGQ